MRAGRYELLAGATTRFKVHSHERVVGLTCVRLVAGLTIHLGIGRFALYVGYWVA